MLIDEFGLHPLALEGAAHGQRRPKVDEYQGLLAARDLRGRPRRGRRGACGPPRWTCSSAGISWSPSTGARVPALEEALARWTRGGPRLREGVGFLVYAVMDAIIDSFAPFLADIEEEIEETEFAVFTRSDEESVRSLLRLKRTLASLRRELHPLRAVFQVLLRRDHPFFPGSTEALPPRGVRPPPADPGHAGRRARDGGRRDGRIAGDRLAPAQPDDEDAGRHHRGDGGRRLRVRGLWDELRVVPLSKEPLGFWLISVGTIGLVAAALLVGVVARVVVSDRGSRTLRAGRGSRCPVPDGPSPLS